MKKHSERRKHCALAVVRRSQKVSPRRRPPSQGRRTAKIESAGDGHYLYLETQFGEDRCMQFRVVVVTVPHTNKHTHPQTRPITIHCAAASAQCNKRMIVVTADPTARMCHGLSWMVWFICLIVSLLSICLTLLVTCVHADYHVFKLL